MTKAEKLLDKFLRVPEPRDLTWDELCSIMRHFGFFWENPSGGSHGLFRNKEGIVIKPAARPHPNPAVKVYQIRAYKAKLKELKLL